MKEKLIIFGMILLFLFGIIGGFKCKYYFWKKAHPNQEHSVIYWLFSR